MLSSLFNPHSGFWRMFSRIADLVGLSLCWLLCSLPILTAGPATAALYDAVYHGVRRDEPPVYRRFFSTFRRELKTGLLVTLPFFALIFLLRFLGWASFQVAVNGNDFAGILVYAYRLAFCVPLVLWYFAMTALSRFTFSAGALIRTSFRLCLSRPLQAVGIGILLFLGGRLMTLWYFSLIFAPALTALLSSFLMERVFAPFLRETEDRE